MLSPNYNIAPARLPTDRGVVRILVNQARERILARSHTGPKQNDWRDQLRDAFRRPAELLSFLELEDTAAASAVQTPFPMLVPRAFASRMRRGDSNDPLLRQVLPDPGELDSRPGYVSDPVGDHGSRQVRGLLHKYHGRALLITTGACAIHCRYCFRQNYPYGDEHLGRRLAPALDYIRTRSDISEVILSGGDPLMLDTERLQQLGDALGLIGHIRRLRIHTRLPVVLPDRIDESFCGWLHNLPWPVVVVIHANHPAEFDPSVDQAIQRLRNAGAHVLNQTVLLAGINDNEEILAELMERSFAAGVIPYYLHLLDKVSGAARFDSEPAVAGQLLERLRVRLPGYLVPRLVREEAGAPYKLPVL
ncbi:MAG: EF-P beta-lysylation protein EpmB [Wenzhouxiangella sp.]|nr:EF-P beta-lysylation protein EpmB [Wenzhouxiangella sp.]TVR97305.1 MAG: EF-P beta-lysylation protein EpmB [Wenzhouxiangellaceae bacterium]